MRSSRAWLLSSALLASASLLGFAIGATGTWALRAGGPPWQLLSAGLAHWNALHLGGNLAGLALIALLGQRAGLRAPDALAWLAAGPLAHALLVMLQPQLPPYAGLSAWLHAGVVIAALGLLAQPGRPRRIGAAIAAGLLAKLALEAPWGPLLRENDWWGGATLPLAHAAGALAGLLSAGLLRTVGALRARRAPADERRAR